MRIFKLLTFLLISSSAFCQQEISTIQLDSGITLTGIIEDFDSNTHNLDTCDSGDNWKFICLIDGTPVWGTDHGLKLPRNQFTRLYITINETDIDLDVTGMFNPSFSKKLINETINFKKYDHGYLISGTFSDGSGAYMVEWKIIGKGSTRTQIKSIN